MDDGPVTRQKVRTGLWCDVCSLPDRVEYEIYLTADNTLVATLKGCRTCRTGVCSPPPRGVIYTDALGAAFAAIVESLT